MMIRYLAIFAICFATTCHAQRGSRILGGIFDRDDDDQEEVGEWNSRVPARVAIRAARNSTITGPIHISVVQRDIDLRRRMFDQVFTVRRGNIRFGRFRFR